MIKREELKQDLHQKIKLNILKIGEFIDKIYDELETKSCEGCIHHKAYNGNFPLSCCECSRFYSDNFEEIKK